MICAKTKSNALEYYSLGQFLKCSGKLFNNHQQLSSEKILLHNLYRNWFERLEYFPNFIWFPDIGEHKLFLELLYRKECLIDCEIASESYNKTHSSLKEIIIEIDEAHDKIESLIMMTKRHFPRNITKSRRVQIEEQGS